MSFIPYISSPSLLTNASISCQKNKLCRTYLRSARTSPQMDWSRRTSSWRTEACPPSSSKISSAGRRPSLLDAGSDEASCRPGRREPLAAPQGDCMLNASSRKVAPQPPIAEKMPRKCGGMGAWAHGGREFLLRSNGTNRPLPLRCDCRAQRLGSWRLFGVGAMLRAHDRGLLWLC